MRVTRPLIWGFLVGMAVLGPVWAQSLADPSGALIARPAALTPMTAISAGEAASQPAALDYGVWESSADRAEAAIEDSATDAAALDQLRRQLVDWRAAFLGAQNANAARIVTLKAQIAALGPPPSDGTPEPEDLAKRRVELADQLVRLQAPGIAAEEAYQRADGLIGELDRTLRDRQAAQLLTLWPAPINPANWPEGLIGVTDTGVRLWEEIGENWDTSDRRDALWANLPLVILVLAIGLGLIIYARAWVQNLAMRLREKGSAGVQRIIALIASLGEVVFPVMGVGLLAFALRTAGMTGDLSTRLLAALPAMALPLIAAAWMAGRIFPRGSLAGPLNLGTEGRAEGRVLSVLLGVMLGVDQLRFAAMHAHDYSDGTTSVASFPGLLITGLLLLRMGQLLTRHLAAAQPRDSETQNFGKSLLSLVARGVMVIGLLGPLVAAIGYVAAASALIYPAVLSLGLIAVLLILQHLVGDIYAMITRTQGEANDTLIPVLANFAVVVCSIPLFALIWGARIADLTEIWTRFRDGFQLGTTRISPTDFLFFAAVFAVGYGLTRVLQGALRSTILPRTGLDHGAQTATVSGVGYVGIFLAGLIAVNAAGIDLSGLAIVAGALSVGIGFGLQAVVSNFVSGIILLIERPVTEGDWIEVGQTQGIVKSISVRSTRIQTFDRSDVIVPNSDLISGLVTNYTRFNLTGRLIVSVGVAFGSDSRKVERVLREIAEAQPLVVMTPPPVVALMGFGADAINFELRMILRDINQIIAVRSEVNHEILRRFAEEGIEIPFAQSDVTLRNVDEIAAMLRAVTGKT